MCATIVPFAPTEDLFQTPAENRKSASAALRTQVRETSRICESEARLWKLSGARNSPAQAIFELLILALFLSIAIVVMAGCLAELSLLMKTDAVGQVASKAFAAGT